MPKTCEEDLDSVCRGCGGASLGRAPEPRLPCASSSARSCPPDPLPAGSGSHSSHAEGGSAAPPAGQKQRQISGHQASSSEANEKAEKVCPEQMTHRPGPCSPDPNVRGLCPLQAPGKDHSHLRSPPGLDSHFPWDCLLPGCPAPTARPLLGRGRDSQQQRQEMNESISLKFQTKMTVLAPSLPHPSCYQAVGRWGSLRQEIY
ncbi:hypothetical protein MC885_003218 [Smutsia gigantea]|nr:hypothetical protein MC885_003218 [Smutsia gigantea]